MCFIATVGLKTAASGTPGDTRNSLNPSANHTLWHLGFGYAFVSFFFSFLFF